MKKRAPRGATSLVLAPPQFRPNLRSGYRAHLPVCRSRLGASPGKRSELTSCASSMLGTLGTLHEFLRSRSGVGVDLDYQSGAGALQPGSEILHARGVPAAVRDHLDVLRSVRERTTPGFSSIDLGATVRADLRDRWFTEWLNLTASGHSTGRAGCPFRAPSRTIRWRLAKSGRHTELDVQSAPTAASAERSCARGRWIEPSAKPTPP